MRLQGNQTALDCGCLNARYLRWTKGTKVWFGQDNGQAVGHLDTLTHRKAHLNILNQSQTLTGGPRALLFGGLSSDYSILMTRSSVQQMAAC